jgi:glycosyltransferase involved in cell wall biosynthesis
MRVLLFTDTLADVNGVSRFIQTLARHARQTGRDLDVATSSRHPLPPAPNLLNLPRWLAVRMPGYPDLDLTLVRRRQALDLARRLEPDVIHASTPGPLGLAARWVARRLRLPLVCTHHTNFPAYMLHLFDDEALAHAARLYLRWFFAPAQRIIARSAATRQDLIDLGVPDRRIAAFTPGIDTRAFSPRFADPAVWSRLDPLPLTPHAPHAPPPVRILYVGRVSIEKGLHRLTDLWPGVVAQARALGHAPRLIIVGDGPWLEPMRRRLTLGPGADTARFLGFRHARELAAIYASADLFVFPSDTDTLGQSVLEAQCSGLPVIVSDRGGPAALVLHRRTGLIVPGLDPANWRSAILSLIADPERRHAMARAAAEHGATFTFSRSFEEWWRLATLRDDPAQRPPDQVNP